MKKKGFTTSTYLLQKNDGKPYGYIKGYVSLPEYTSNIKIHIINSKEVKGTDYDIEGFYGYSFGIEEIENIKKGIETIENQIKTLITLSKRKQLKDEFYTHYQIN